MYLLTAASWQQQFDKALLEVMKDTAKLHVCQARYKPSIGAFRERSQQATLSDGYWDVRSGLLEHLSCSTPP